MQEVAWTLSSCAAGVVDDTPPDLYFKTDIATKLDEQRGRRPHPGRYAVRRACARLQPVDAAYRLLAPVAPCERFGYAKCRPRQQ